MHPQMPPRPLDRVARLRLPDLPPRDLEGLAAAGIGPHSAPAPSSAPDSAGYLPPPSATPTKFGGQGSPADVRGYTVTPPLLMRGGVVSPGVGGGSGLVLPTISLPLTTPPSSHHPPTGLSQQHLSSQHQQHLNHSPLSLGSHPQLIPTSSHPTHHQLMHQGGTMSSRSGARTTPSSPVTAPCVMSQTEIKKAQNRKSAKRFREAQKQRWKNMADDLMAHKRTIDELRAQLAAQANNALRVAQQQQHHQMHNKQQMHGGHAMNVHHHLASIDGKRSSVSINDLVDIDMASSINQSGATGGAYGECQSHAEAEAALYAQILCSSSNKLSSFNSCMSLSSTTNLAAARGHDSNKLGAQPDMDGNGIAGGNRHGRYAQSNGESRGVKVNNVSSNSSDSNGSSSVDNKMDTSSTASNVESNVGGTVKGVMEPYAKELGLLSVCLVVEKGTCRVVSVRRGSPAGRGGVGWLATEGLSHESAAEFRNGVSCGKAVVLGAERNGAKVRLAMKPVEGSDRVVVAEFVPL